MANRDFFAFCTSLRPLELKSLGAFSQVRHIGAEELIYRAGDRADTLYIINRGMVEIVQENGAGTAAGTYLSRGDIFGDVEMLTDLPRKHSVRAREQVSVQCFRRKDFPDLVRSVPSFFRYLSEQLAGRLLQARDATLSRSHCLELSGSLANFDLVTIYQTIVHSSQTGELSIVDEEGETLAAFHFEAGHPCSGQFQHLTGEEAFAQLFLTDELHGTFSFCSGQGEITQATRNGSFARDADELLIGALQARDELEALRKEMPDPSAHLLRQKLEIATDGIAPHLRDVAEKVWSLASGGRLCLREISAKVEVSELKIYQAVKELTRTGQLEVAVSAIARKVA